MLYLEVDLSSPTEALERFIADLSPADRQDLDKLLADELAKPWLPTPGPQLEAYLSPADLLLYGGAAGGGKSELLLGLATCEASRSVIFRRQHVDLRGIEDRLIAIIGAQGYNRSDKIWRGPGRVIELGHLGEPGSELSWQGRPHDFIGFDEGAQLNPNRVNFVLGWLRSADPERRCRAVIATNPPMGGEGAWLIEWFAPWLDPMFSNPAAPGELRWAVTVGTEDAIRTIWVDGSGPVEIAGETYLPLSRTYVPSRLDDNPYLRDTGYRAQINSMPEPLRTQLLYGDFLAGRVDDPWQVIPTAWVEAANARWETNKGRQHPPMLHMGVDVAQGGGGGGTTSVACLRGVRFDEITELPGAQTPDPVSVVQLVLGVRRDDAGITIDMTGGWGGGVRSHLATHNGIQAWGFVASAASPGRTADGKLGFVNARSESWWRMREGLDPEGGERMELPPDTKLKAQLTAPRWKLRGDKILVEAKEELMKRLGSSTDRADAVNMAWLDRKRSVVRGRKKAEARASHAPVVNPLAGF